MIKKITLFIILSYLLISCGKKGDPEFKESYKKYPIQNTLINKV